MNYEEGKLTFLPKHALHSSFIHSFIFVQQGIKFTWKNVTVIRMALQALAPKSARKENGQREKGYNSIAS